jgi:hypothetical protein
MLETQNYSLTKVFSCVEKLWNVIIIMVVINSFADFPHCG